MKRDNPALRKVHMKNKTDYSSPPFTVISKFVEDQFTNLAQISTTFCG